MVPCESPFIFDKWWFISNFERNFSQCIIPGVISRINLKQFIIISFNINTIFTLNISQISLIFKHLWFLIPYAIFIFWILLYSCHSGFILQRWCFSFAWQLRQAEENILNSCFGIPLASVSAMLTPAEDVRIEASPNLLARCPNSLEGRKNWVRIINAIIVKQD